MKAKTIFYCTECGNETPKWQGRCPACGAWNTMVERPAEKAPKKSPSASRGSALGVALNRPKAMAEVETTDELRFPTGMGEVLVGGAPGIGKSTLMLQICDHLCRTAKVLYVSGEESERQIKLRAERLQVRGEGLSLLSETNLENVIDAVHAVSPDVLIVDSRRAHRGLHPDPVPRGRDRRPREHQPGEGVHHGPDAAGQGGGAHHLRHRPCE